MHIILSFHKRPIQKVFQRIYHNSALLARIGIALL